MDVPEGKVTKPPRVLFISLWRLLLFGITRKSVVFHCLGNYKKFLVGPILGILGTLEHSGHFFNSVSVRGFIIKDKDLIPEPHAPSGGKTQQE